MRCLCLKCPNLKFRYSQGKKATEITGTIVELLKKGEFENVGYRKPVSQIPMHVPHDVEGLETRQSTKKKIIEALEDEGTFIVGICGMPGIGKTTMAKEIANNAQKFFDDVAFVVVSKDPVINKVQDDIAKDLGLKIEENSEEARARRLCDRLSRDDQKKILVILDDVWKEIKFERIGFPAKVARKGLKILLTSRFQRVCTEMGADRIVDVEVLHENEALKLLKGAAGISNDTSVEDLAIQVAKECGGLPLSLVIIGKRLVNAEEFVWRDTLHKLRNCKVGEEKVYKSIEISYNMLKPEGDKSLFLLCSLFPEDYNISIETLVRYARGLEIFKDTAMLSETRDRVYSVAVDLKSCYLLLPGDEDKEYEVKLHDVVRDFCLKVASQGKDVYMVKQNGVKECPKHDKDDSLTAISLEFDDQSKNELRSGLEYLNLKLLRMVCRSQDMNILDDFFSKMNQLRVVDFNSSLFNHIPSSLQSLINLHTLCLDDCKLDTELSTIGSLKKLETLSFFGSELYEFPIEIAQLSSLKSLDLRLKKYLCPLPLPRGVLSSLNELEELYLGASFAIQRDGKEYIIGELSSLKGLQIFQILVNDRRFLLQMLRSMHLENLQRYQIICTENSIENGENHFGRSLLLEKLEASAIKESTIHGLLLPKIDFLLLKDVEGSFKNLVSELDKDGFVKLKTLVVNRCSFEYLIDATGLLFNPTSAFSKLEKLELHYLCDLKGICNGNLPLGAFAKLQKVDLQNLPRIEYLWRGVIKPPSLYSLRDFHIWDCDVIKSLFSESGAKCLGNLETVSIRACEMLEHIVARDVTESEISYGVLELKKLQFLRLFGLGNLKSFRSQSNVDSKALFNQVAFPNLKSLYVDRLDNIDKIVGDEMQPKALEKLRSVYVRSCRVLSTIAQSDSIKALQNLRSLDVGECEAIDVLFELEGLKVIEDETLSILSWLTSLCLSNLSKLVHIVRRVPKGIRVFENLTSLEIYNCNSIRYLFTPSMASSLTGLETLRLDECEAIEQIIGKELEEIEVAKPAAFEGDRLNKLVFPKLSNIWLVKLKRLRMFCSENIELMFPSLHEIDIDDCGGMVKFSQMSIAPRLKKLHIRRGNLSSQMSWIQDTFPNLEELCVQKVDCVSKTLLSDEIQPTALEKVRSLEVRKCGEVTTIAESNSIKALQNLEWLRVVKCKATDVLFELEGLKVTEDETQSILSRLTYLHLLNLSKLVHIVRRVPKGICVFQNLTSLKIVLCNSLRYLFTPCLASSLTGLETLNLCECEAIEEIIIKELEEIEVAEPAAFEGDQLNKLVFPKLSALCLVGLPSLRMFCCENIELMFPSLHHLAIANCPLMVKFCSQEPLAPELKKIQIGFEDEYVDFSNVLDPAVR